MLEGSISVVDSTVKWLRDNISIIHTFEDIGALASKFKFTDGAFFIAAFSGLLSSYWCDDARGRLVGVTQSTGKRHIIRATSEIICLSTRTVLKAMNMDRSISLKALKADDGMSNSDQCMQIQVDVFGIPLSRLDMRIRRSICCWIGVRLQEGY
ncbi:hypothetical protein G6F66_000723 [Rhizopus arrhizus]|nr:hypothetical protein G6F66_000723 [Rhizopus arrhizus]